MKIVHKIIIANIFSIALIASISIVAYQKVDLILAKLRFVEIADDINASFLEMRLAEKNYFLYGDESALQQIWLDLGQTFKTVDSLRGGIIRAVGEKKFEEFLVILENYRDVIKEAKARKTQNQNLQKSVREAGQKLREFSATATKLERNKVNKIIATSRRGLFIFFCLILLAAITATCLLFPHILNALKRIEKTADSISHGNFEKMEGRIPPDELGSVMRAINSMSEELEHRYEQIIQSKKLASLGVLTAGVAHELGNPLNNISMTAQAYIELADSLKKEAAIDYMETIEVETHRIKNIVQDLLDFSKPKPTDFKQVPINDVIRKSLKLVYNMLHISGIEVELSLAEGLPQVSVDVDKIQEVLINLITNAIHASPAGGVLSIATHLSEDKDYVVIEAKDSGHGIPPEHLPHVFDPFFSTKGVSGTGLGLSVSYGIIKNHKGNMSVESKVGIGTTFTIELPVQR